ncbi:anthrax toxin lethal factor-related metalloendopeptidase [Schinkia sp. CFF1]
MRRLVAISFFLLSFLPALTLAQEKVSGLTLDEAEQQYNLVVNLDNQEVKDLVDQIVLVPDEDNYNHDEVKGMVSRIAHIHPTFLQYLVVNNVKVKLFSGKLTDEPYFDDLKGVTPRGWSKDKTWDQVPGAGGKYIAAAKIGASDQGNGHGSINLELHEIGHTVERTVFKGLRNDEDFLKIWAKEVPVLFPGDSYFNSYPEEYFAEVFAMYYLNKDTNLEVQMKAPKTYAYIHKFEGN